MTTPTWGLNQPTSIQLTPHIETRTDRRKGHSECYCKAILVRWIVDNLCTHQLGQNEVNFPNKLYHHNSFQIYPKKTPIVSFHYLHHYKKPATVFCMTTHANRKGYRKILGQQKEKIQHFWMTLAKSTYSTSSQPPSRTQYPNYFVGKRPASNQTNQGKKLKITKHVYTIWCYYVYTWVACPWCPSHIFILVYYLPRESVQKQITWSSLHCN